MRAAQPSRTPAARLERASAASIAACNESIPNAVAHTDAYPRGDPWGLSVAWEKGHSMWTTAGCVWCRKCALYAVLRPRGLRTKCLGHVPKRRDRVLKRLLAGLHPDTGFQLGEPRPLPSPVALARAWQKTRVPSATAAAPSLNLDELARRAETAALALAPSVTKYRRRRKGKAPPEEDDA